MIERKDREHSDYATTDGRVLCSFNVGDFLGLHAQFLAEGRPHAGLILTRQQRYSVGEQMRCILRLVATLSADDMRNRVEFLNAWAAVDR